MPEKTMKDLFYHTLKDVNFAESLILKTLPKLIKVAGDAKLKAALESHMHETETQIKRIAQVFELIGMKAEAVPCEAIKGILHEGDEVIEMFKGTIASDAALIASCQAVEHYEITRYGTMRRWATELKLKPVANLLDETLNEEYNADDTLTAIAEKTANPKAEGQNKKAG